MKRKKTRLWPFVLLFPMFDAIPLLPGKPKDRRRARLMNLDIKKPVDMPELVERDNEEKKSDDPCPKKNKEKRTKQEAS